MTTPHYSDQRVMRARIGVLVLFASMGMLLSTFLSRIPSIRDLLEANPARLALLMMCGAIGALTALMITGWAVAKFGSRKVLYYSSVGYAISFVAVAWVSSIGSQPGFAIVEFFLSFSFAFANVGMNTEASVVERATGRSILAQFHASFSIGMVIGLGLGAYLSHHGASVLVHLSSAAIILLVVRLLFIKWAVLDGDPKPASEIPKGGPFAVAKVEYRERRVLMIGGIIFGASMVEGIAANWISLSIVDDFGKTEAVADMMYWTFLAAMVFVRLAGGRFVDRFGRVITIRVSMVSVSLGVILMVFAPDFWLVPVGLAFWGFGAALGVPIGFSAAADDPKRAAARVAAVSSFATIANLLVPQAVGNIAEFSSIREALLLVLVGTALTYALARAVRTHGPMFKSHRKIARIKAQQAKDQAMAPVAVSEITVMDSKL